MTMAHGGAGRCWMGTATSPSRGRIETSSAMGSVRTGGSHRRRAHVGRLAADMDSVPAELVAQRGENAPRERIGITRVEAGEQREGDDRGRDVLVDGGL